MCGIVGLFQKQGESSRLGEFLVGMCQELYRRGPDSVGFALYGPPPNGALVVRVDLDRPDHESAARFVIEAAEELTTVKDWLLRGRNVRLLVTSDAEGKLADGTEERVPGARVFSVGRSMEIIKDLGSAEDVDRAYEVSSFGGTHGIGHTRMATESRVDIAHSHPFWAKPFPDIAVVHNGQITNYHKLRRLLAMKGHRFSTENDSEVIAVYIADRLEAGESLEDALRASVSDLAGTFPYPSSTAQGVGLARDQFPTNPLLYAGDDDMVVLASEEVAIRRAFSDPNLVPRELQAKEVRWWLR